MPVRFVQRTPELERVLAIPRRTLYIEGPSAEKLARDLSDALRLPHGKQELRPIQAASLYELWKVGGLLASVRVGGGKTLVSQLAPVVRDAKRPILILPASLIEKTRREARALAQHWPIPVHLRLFSYEWLGRTQAAEELERYGPDMIIADECHKLKNPKAAVTKRLVRYMHKHPETCFVALSGTITKRSLRDYAHLLTFCLPPLHCPVPLKGSELIDWADALDVKKDDAPPSCEVGALWSLCTAEERNAGADLSTVRKAFRRRLTETAGVVATSDRFLGASLVIGAVEAKAPDTVAAAFAGLRATWTTPDGWPLSEPMAVWRHARELALGFYYVWDPRPPHEWLDARKAWSQICRQILSDNRRQLDSEKQVVQAIDSGFYPLAEGALADWRDVRDSFVPHTRPVWLDTYALDAVARWGEHGGIVWCEHVAFAEELARRTGWTYYGAKGLSSDNRFVEDSNEETIIVSQEANRTGRNLQYKWSRNLLTSPLSNGLGLEQLLGRTHRDGQPEDEVTADVLMLCREHARAIRQAVVDAHYIQESTGQEQKLVYADFAFDLDQYDMRTGPLWEK